MSEENITHSNNDAGEFERQDLSPRAVFAFLGGLAVAACVIILILLGMYRFLDRYEAQHQPPQNPLSSQAVVTTRQTSDEDVKKFPEPRLEKDERGEINEFRLREEQTLHSYGWVDQKAGTVHIPIERAMELIAERGLPTRQQVGAVPPSPVNVAREAAAKADRSQKKPPNR